MKTALVDKLLLGTGVLVLAGTAIASFTMIGGPTFTVLAARGTEYPERPFTPVVAAPADATVHAWEAPGAQSRGPAWIFEVFTPPIIYFDTRAGEFTVEPPLPPSAAPTEAPFGLTVLAVERQLYRFQVEGYLVGPAGNLYLLKDTETGEGLRLREGQRDADAAVTLRSGRIERRVITPDDPSQTPTTIEVVTVSLQDERLGEAVELTNLAPRYNPRVEARVRVGSSERTVTEGDRLEGADGQFIIRRIDLESRRVTVEKSLADGTSRSRDLAPGAP